MQDARHVAPCVCSRLAARLRSLTPAAAARAPRVALSRECDFFSQVGERGGEWFSCGYRNAQLVFSACARDAALNRRLFDGTLAADRLAMPDFSSLALWIDRAHALGFDAEGAAQLGSVAQTDKYIGGSEVLSVLRSFGIPCRLVCFHGFDSPLIEPARGGGAAAAAAERRRRAEADLLADTGLTAVRARSGGWEEEAASERSARHLPPPPPSRPPLHARRTASCDREPTT